MSEVCWDIFEYLNCCCSSFYALFFKYVRASACVPRGQSRVDNYDITTQVFSSTEAMWEVIVQQNLVHSKCLPEEAKIHFFLGGGRMNIFNFKQLLTTNCNTVRRKIQDHFPLSLHWEEETHRISLLRFDWLTPHLRHPQYLWNSSLISLPPSLSFAQDGLLIIPSVGPLENSQQRTAHTHGMTSSSLITIWNDILSTADDSLNQIMDQNTEAATLQLHFPGGVGPFHGGLHTNTQRSAAPFFLPAMHTHRVFSFCQTIGMILQMCIINFTLVLYDGSHSSSLGV